MRLSRRLVGSAVLGAALLLPGTGTADHHETAEQASEGAARSVMVGEAIELKGKVVSIDPEARIVVVEGELGRRIEIAAPEAAANFDKVSVGDAVVARYYQSIAVAIAPVTDAEPGASEVAAVALAPPGATPGGVIAKRIQLRAVVNAVDPETRSVTLDVPSGGQRILKAGEGIDLEKVKPGEQVSVTFTQALAISIAPPE